MTFEVFHIHVYFSPSTREHAEHLRAQIIQVLKLSASRLVDRPIGPHLQPMFQANFRLAQFAPVIEFLLNHRGPLDILIHPNTGDDVVDHTQHALWLGNPVPLDIEFLKNLTP